MLSSPIRPMQQRLFNDAASLLRRPISPFTPGLCCWLNRRFHTRSSAVAVLHRSTGIDDRIESGQEDDQLLYS